MFSLHFIFRDQGHLDASVIADPAVTAAFRKMISEQGAGRAGARAHAPWACATCTRKKEIKSVEDIKGQKVRVQATKTEDTHFPAYGAQTVHMPFGEVYTSLQTGVVNIAENGVNVYLANKHYEVAPIMSMTEHEANNNCIWVSQKTWDSLTDEQKKWVQAAADEVSKTEPAKALQAREGFGRAAEEDGRQDRRQCRQVGLRQGRRADPGPTRQGAGTQRRDDSRARAQREVSRPEIA